MLRNAGNYPLNWHFTSNPDQELAGMIRKEISIPDILSFQIATQGEFVWILDGMDYTAYKFNTENNEIINYFKINENHNWLFPYMVYGGLSFLIALK